MIQFNNPYETNSTKPEDILCDAAKYIEKYGWRTHNYGGNGTPACAVGAITTVAGYNYSLIYPAMALLETRIHAPSIAIWNDTIAKDAQEVIRVMKGNHCE